MNVPSITEVFKKDFFLTLQIIVITRRHFSFNKAIVDKFDNGISTILALSNADLGISYQGGMFFPKGEEILDKELVGESLKILSNYLNEDKDLRNALMNYSSGSKYGVIENCYRCTEGLLRQILRNNKTLIDNKPEILKKLNLTDHWKKILAQYIEYGNEYGRHASDKRHNLNDEEVEGYLYMTCVLVRLILKAK